MISYRYDTVKAIRRLNDKDKPWKALMKRVNEREPLFK